MLQSISSCSLIIWLTGLSSFAASANEAPTREVQECGVAEVAVRFDPNVCGFSKPLRREEHCAPIYREDFNAACPSTRRFQYLGPWKQSSSVGPADTYCKKSVRIPVGTSKTPACGPAFQPSEDSVLSFHTPTSYAVKSTENVTLRCAGGRGLTVSETWIQGLCEQTALGRCRHVENGVEDRELCETRDQSLWTVNQCDAGRSEVPVRFHACPIWKTRTELDSWIAAKSAELPRLAGALALSAGNYYAQSGGEVALWCTIKDFEQNPLYAGKVPELKDTFRAVFSKDPDSAVFSCRPEDLDVIPVLDFQCGDGSIVCQNAQFFQSTAKALIAIRDEIETRLISDVVPSTNEAYAAALRDLSSQVAGALNIPGGAEQ